MKLFFGVFLLLAFTSILHAAQIVIPAPVEHLFVPKGFDNNDNVEVVVSGAFPNSCYSRNKVDVAVVDQNINVKITALQNTTTTGACKELEISFLENVTIGSLQAGTYKISVNGILEESLIVGVSPSQSVDDHVYAMIAYVELGFTQGRAGNAMLVGMNMNDCLKLDRVEYISNGVDTLSILPIVKKVTECSGRKEYFEIPIKFDPNDFSGDLILLFVKTMDGKSVSAMIDKDGY
jgi:hypothetical protein